MAEAKKYLGDISCIVGNISASLLVTGTVETVKDTCRKLIETYASGGGYILAYGASIDKGKIENVKAMMESAYKYGL